LRDELDRQARRQTLGVGEDAGLLEKGIGAHPT